MNLRQLHLTNPDFDLPVSEIVTLNPIHNADLISVTILNILRVPAGQRVPSFRIEASPTETELTTKELVQQVLFPYLEREMFGKPFPFYWIDSLNYFVNISLLNHLEVVTGDDTLDEDFYMVHLAFKNPDLPDSPSNSANALYTTPQLLMAELIQEQLLDARAQYLADLGKYA